MFHANARSGHPFSDVYLDKHVVIGPANHSYDWVALVKEHRKAMVLRESIPMPQRSSRKEGACGEWFSESAKKELAALDGEENEGTNYLLGRKKFLKHSSNAFLNINLISLEECGEIIACNFPEECKG